MPVKGWLLSGFNQNPAPGQTSAETHDKHLVAWFYRSVPAVFIQDETNGCSGSIAEAVEVEQEFLPVQPCLFGNMVDYPQISLVRDYEIEIRRLDSGFGCDVFNNFRDDVGCKDKVFFALHEEGVFLVFYCLGSDRFS